MIISDESADFGLERLQRNVPDSRKYCRRRTLRPVQRSPVVQTVNAGRFTIETPHPQFTAVLAGMFLALTIGTIVRRFALRGKPDDLVRARLGSLEVWWVMAILLTIALIIGRGGIAVLLGILSTLGFREFVQLTGAAKTGRLTMILAFGLIPLTFLWLWLGWWDTFVVGLPLLGLLVLAAARVLGDWPQGFVKSAASLFWGLMLIVYCPAHVMLPYSLPESATAPVGAAGLVLYLLLLTEGNDIAQALVGRKFGKHKATPAVSPGKSWEGLIGGIVITSILAILLAPWLTKFPGGQMISTGWGEVTIPILWPLLAGLLISLAGFVGDITFSAVKRDVGVKDSGRLLPGQGGILDRIDSLTFTAPLFAYYVKWILT